MHRIEPELERKSYIQTSVADKQKKTQQSSQIRRRLKFSLEIYVGELQTSLVPATTSLEDMNMRLIALVSEMEQRSNSVIKFKKINVRRFFFCHTASTVNSVTESTYLGTT